MNQKKMSVLAPYTASALPLFFVNQVQWFKDYFVVDIVFINIVLYVYLVHPLITEIYTNAEKCSF